MRPERGAAGASDGLVRVAVLASVGLEPRHAAQIEAVDPRVRVVRVTDRATWQAEAPNAEVILGFRPLRGGALTARRLRWVHALGAGVENLSGDVAGTEIIITNNHVHGDAIAEHVFGMILAYTRQMRQVFASQVDRHWAHGDLISPTLAGRTMGILGLGTIGAEVARRAAAFKMRVVGTKRTPGSVPGVERVLPPDDLDEVLRVSNVLVLTLPLTPATRGLLGRREIALLPPGAFLVNVGRGGLVDEAALIDALRDGRLGGAGLDVFEEEPLPLASPLWTLPTVIMTPHVSGDFPGYLDTIMPLFCDNLRRYLAGAPLHNVVDPARGY